MLLETIDFNAYQRTEESPLAAMFDGRPWTVLGETTHGAVRYVTERR